MTGRRASHLWNPVEGGSSLARLLPARPIRADGPPGSVSHSALKVWAMYRRRSSPPPGGGVSPRAKPIRMGSGRR